MHQRSRLRAITLAVSRRSRKCWGGRRHPSRCNHNPSKLIFPVVPNPQQRLLEEIPRQRCNGNGKREGREKESPFPWCFSPRSFLPHGRENNPQHRPVKKIYTVRNRA